MKTIVGIREVEQGEPIMNGDFFFDGNTVWAAPEKIHGVEYQGNDGIDQLYRVIIGYPVLSFPKK